MPFSTRILGHITAVSPPNWLSCITNQRSSISPQVTNNLFKMISEISSERHMIIRPMSKKGVDVHRKFKCLDQGLNQYVIPG